MIVYNEGDISSNYPAAGAVSAETSGPWSDVLRPFLARYYRPTVLDLGCGTGRFSMLIAQRPRAAVIGVDPSIAMLRKALGAAEIGNICYAVAEAERLPLVASSCDLVWMSQVVHHIPDRRSCATELHRVLRPNGVLLIRGTFGDRLEGFPALFQFFPYATGLTPRVPPNPQILTAFSPQG